MNKNTGVEYGYQRMNVDKTWQHLDKTFDGGCGNVATMYRLDYYIQQPPRRYRTAHELQRNEFVAGCFTIIPLFPH